MTCLYLKRATFRLQSTEIIEIAGVVGEIDPAVAEAYGVGERVAWLELNLSALLDCPHGERQFRPVSRFPSSDVDLAFVVADEVAAGDVANTLRQADLLLVSDVSLFDVYRSDQLAPGTRSLAYRIRFQAADRTLREDELAEVRQACIQAVVRSHGGTLRA